MNRVFSAGVTNENITLLKLFEITNNNSMLIRILAVFYSRDKFPYAVMLDE